MFDKRDTQHGAGLAILAWLNINILQTESSLASIIRILAFSKKVSTSLQFLCLENQIEEVREARHYLHQFPR